MPILHTFQSEEEWIAASVAEILKSSNKNSLSLVLSGGSTPKPVYTALAKELSKRKELHLQIFQADERFVPQTHPDSNARLIKESFLSFLEPNISSEVSFFPTDISLEDSAIQYEKLLQKRTVPFDACILGIGNDGHIASLFPNASTLDEKTKLSVSAHTEIFAVPERLTMTFSAILSSKKIVILLKGAQKKLVLEELLSGNLLPEHFPAKFLLSHENVQIFLNA